MTRWMIIVLAVLTLSTAFATYKNMGLRDVSYTQQSNIRTGSNYYGGGGGWSSGGGYRSGK